MLKMEHRATFHPRGLGGDPKHRGAIRPKPQCKLSRMSQLLTIYANPGYKAISYAIMLARLAWQPRQLRRREDYAAPYGAAFRHLGLSCHHGFSAPTLCYVAQFQPCAEVRQSGETERQPKGCGMAENKLKERWKAGKAAVNGWLAIPSGCGLPPDVNVGIKFWISWCIR
jgi:hypothetical protein